MGERIELGILFSLETCISLVWWCILKIPATWEVETGGLQFEASLSKVIEILSQKQSKTNQG
jgi:hypothetical protein